VCQRQLKDRQEALDCRGCPEKDGVVVLGKDNAPDNDKKECGYYSVAPMADGNAAKWCLAREL